MKNNLTKIAILSSFLFAISVSCYGNKIENDELYQVLKQYWQKRDGAANVYIHTAILQVIVLDVTSTLHWLSQEQSIKESLLTNLQNDVFTDFRGDQKGKLTDLKEKTLKTLKDYLKNVTNEQNKKVAEELVSRLSSVNIRIVD
ncbi:MAG: hypothetical protein JW915_21470 [Chitinispirillaceae bacterium]|nr:hypothetical protein [Chitinispirillaceae bacterium]